MEFCYYGSNNDTISIINSILKETELKLIPEKNYREPKVEFYRFIDENIADMIERRQSFYLWDTGMYPNFPLDMKELEWGEFRGTFFIKESPSLSLTVPRFLEEKSDERIQCICGMLTHSKQLYNRQTNEVIPIQDKVMNEYKKVVKIMKNELVKVKNKSLWIGKEAYKLFSEKELEVIYNGEWITGE